MFVNRGQIVRAFWLQQVKLAHCPGADNLRDIARHNFSWLRFARLIANRDSFSGFDQLRNIILRSMIRHSTHRHAVTLGQCNVEQRSRFFRILEKQFIKVAQPKEQEHIRWHTGAHPLVLLHHRGKRIGHISSFESAAQFGESVVVVLP